MVGGVRGGLCGEVKGQVDVRGEGETKVGRERVCPATAPLSRANANRHSANTRRSLHASLPRSLAAGRRGARGRPSQGGHRALPSAAEAQHDA